MGECLVLSETPFAVFLPGACFEKIEQSYTSALGLGWACAIDGDWI